MRFIRAAAIIVLLTAAAQPAAFAQRLQQSYATGKESFEKRCAMCHQLDGSGKWSEEGGFPPLTGLSEWMATPEGRLYVARVIYFGPYGEVQVGDKVYIGMMPRYAPRMTNKEIVAVVRYVGEVLNKPLPGYVPIDESVVAAARALPDNMKAVSEARDALPPR